MKKIFDSINTFFEFIVPISDFLWDFPTNLSWYSSIPILGKFSAALLLLIGAGIYFSFKLRFIQITQFKKGIQILMRKKSSDIGTSPLTAFMLSSAMRVGPGNILGVTGAISVGGPGALFWMWVMAFFGMATAFVESTLGQIFKEKNGDEFVGGLPYYGKVLLGGKQWVGTSLSVIFILAFMFNVPGQTFHLFTSLGSFAGLATGEVYDRTSIVYYIIAIMLVISVGAIILGGMKRVTKVTDYMVPIMAVIYSITILLLILVNIDKIPYFISAVFGGAFSPKAVFGGAIGTAIYQGVRRGLMSNEAGQGTITMAASIADNKHPVEQGLTQSLGVFLDTMIICTMTGFIVTMAQIWNVDPSNFEAIRESKIDVYLTSVSQLVPGVFLDNIVQMILALSYGLFAFTTLIGLIAFSEIAASRISKSKKWAMAIRLTGAFLFVPFGALTVLAGLELGNLWYISDFTNILLVVANVPVILIGFKYVKKATEHYLETDGEKFESKHIGKRTEFWGEITTEAKSS